MTLRRFLAAGALALVVGAVLPAPVQAATYRYWSYWIGDTGDWVFSSMGPASRIPVDGAVEGWRFGEAGLGGGASPAMAPEFDTVCEGTEQPAEGKRVAVIVDPGSSDEAPDGEQPPGAWAMCVTAGADATAYAILRSAAQVRVDRGLVCGIGGYPAVECAVVVGQADDQVTPSPTPKPTKEPAPDTSRSPKETASPTTETASERPRPDASAATGETSEPLPPSDAAPTKAPSPATTPSSSSPSPPATSAPADATPSPTVSLLATPVTPPTGGGGGSAVLTVVALLAVGGLAAAAVLRSRRRRT